MIPDRHRPRRSFRGSVVLATRLVSPNHRQQEVPALRTQSLALADPLRARQPGRRRGLAPPARRAACRPRRPRGPPVNPGQRRGALRITAPSRAQMVGDMSRQARGEREPLEVLDAEKELFTSAAVSASYASAQARRAYAARPRSRGEPSGSVAFGRLTPRSLQRRGSGRAPLASEPGTLPKNAPQQHRALRPQRLFHADQPRGRRGRRSFPVSGSPDSGGASPSWPGTSSAMPSTVPSPA